MRALAVVAWLALSGAACSRAPEPTAIGMLLIPAAAPSVLGSQVSTSNADDGRIARALAALRDDALIRRVVADNRLDRDPRLGSDAVGAIRDALTVRAVKDSRLVEVDVAFADAPLALLVCTRVMHAYLDDLYRPPTPPTPTGPITDRSIELERERLLLDAATGPRVTIVDECARPRPRARD